MYRTRHLYAVASLMCMCAGILGCGGDSADDDEPKKSDCGYGDTYEQDFGSTAALLVLEIHCKPVLMGSGWLVRKDKGVFFTAYHVVEPLDVVPVGKIRIFFNGRVYDGMRIDRAETQDIAAVAIINPFDAGIFPDPVPLATDTIMMGNRVALVGIHLHPPGLGAKNFGRYGPTVFRPLSVFSEYYGIRFGDPKQQMEFSFDSLPGYVMTSNKQVAIRGLAAPDSPNELVRLRYRKNRYGEVDLDDNHNTRLAGLSGGPVFISLYPQGLLVLGAVTAEPMPRLEYGPKGELKNSEEFLSWITIVYDIAVITAVSHPEVRALYRRIMNVP